MEPQKNENRYLISFPKKLGKEELAAQQNELDQILAQYQGNGLNLIIRLDSIHVVAVEIIKSSILEELLEHGYRVEKSNTYKAT